MNVEYPTEEDLQKIEKFDLIKNDVMELLDLLESIWYAADWGFIKKGKRVIRLELHTAGWSGNEEIIASLRKNYLFWSMYWRKHLVGGHYYFRIKPMKKPKPPSNTPISTLVSSDAEK